MTTFHFPFIKIFQKPQKLGKNPSKMVDRMNCSVYNVCMMTENETNRIPPALIQEADNMAKETGMSFRDCLDILMTKKEEPIPEAFLLALA